LIRIYKAKYLGAKMKIGIDARMINATGIGRYTGNLIEGLARVTSGNEYMLFLKKEEYDSFKVPASNFKKVLADFSWYGVSEQVNFPHIIESNEIDLMHFPHFNVPIFYKGKFVITIHDLTLHRFKTVRASTKSLLTYQFKHLAYKYIISTSVRKAAQIIVPSEFTKKELMDILKTPEEKIIVTYEGGPSELLLKKSPDNRIIEKFKINMPYILYVGNAYPHKNLENLIRSVSYLPDKTMLVLAGKIDEFYEKIKGLVSELDLKEKVIFTDFVTDEELVSLYKNASVYAFPSLNEGFGLPSLEALSFGLPVVCSGLSCLPEILNDAAIYFNPRDTKDIASKIKEALDNSQTKERLINKGFEQVKKFSWDEMAIETLKVYENAIK